VLGGDKPEEAMKAIMKTTKYESGYIGAGIEQAIVGAMILFALIGFVLGGLVFWVAPKAWAWLKPWIHAITA
jgi:hypothetical protein